MLDGFQFYLSSIKSDLRKKRLENLSTFQFYLSSIKSVLTLLITMASTSFNSTLVQLKG